MMRSTVRTLDPLAVDREFVARRPAVLYYLGRAHHGNADYAKGVQALERWLAIARQAPQH